MNLLHLIFVMGALCLSGSARAVDGATVETLLDTDRSWNGAPVKAWPAGRPQIKVLRYTIAPETSLAWHRHPVPTVGHVIRGRLTVEVQGGPARTFGPGETFGEVIGTWHRGVNKGKEAVEILVFQAGVQGKPVTVLQK